MPRFNITAELTVDLCIDIEAESEADAVQIFRRQAMVTAGLEGADDENSFFVHDDSISEVVNFSVTPVIPQSWGD